MTYHFPVHIFSQCFIHLNQPGKILPASGGGKNTTIYRIFHSVEILSAKLQIRNHCRMDSLLISILFPYLKVRLYINSLNSVESYHIEFADRFIIFRWISCRHDHPAFRYFLIAKSLSLKKLEHHRRQRFRYAVNLINKQNSLFQSGLFHLFIDRCNNLAHRIFCDGKTLTSKGFLFDKG